MSEAPTIAEHANSRAWEEVTYALKCLQDAFDGRGAGPSGLRAQAMAHLKQAILLRQRAERFR